MPPIHQQYTKSIQMYHPRMDLIHVKIYVRENSVPRGEHGPSTDSKIKEYLIMKNFIAACMVGEELAEIKICRKLLYATYLLDISTGMAPQYT